MEKSKTQHYNYVFEAIPILFHSQTDHFMKYIEKDGVKFLRFWWDHVGDRLDETKRTPSEGIDVDIVDHDETTKIVYVSLPRPRHDQEGYFLALVARPEKRFAWVRIPNTRVFVLRRADAIKQPPSTEFGELTPRALYKPLLSGIDPNKAAFKKTVEKILRRKTRGNK